MLSSDADVIEGSVLAIFLIPSFSLSLSLSLSPSPPSLSLSHSSRFRVFDCLNLFVCARVPLCLRFTWFHCIPQLQSAVDSTD